MDRILSLIENYGYLVVLFGVLLESTGAPLPGETILLAVGVLAQRGHLDLEDTIALGILGAVVGDQIGYWVGPEGGRPFVLRWGRYVSITPRGWPAPKRSSGGTVAGLSLAVRPVIRKYRLRPMVQTSAVDSSISGTSGSCQASRRGCSRPRARCIRGGTAEDVGSGAR
jgi:hypothetical protein